MVQFCSFPLVFMSKIKAGCHKRFLMKYRIEMNAVCVHNGFSDREWYTRKRDGHGARNGAEHLWREENRQIWGITNINRKIHCNGYVSCVITDLNFQFRFAYKFLRTNYQFLKNSFANNFPLLMGLRDCIQWRQCRNFSNKFRPFPLGNTWNRSHFQ
jgi:hypothetical protein